MAAAAKAKAAPANGAAPKGKGAKVPSSSKSTPDVASKTVDASEPTPSPVAGSGRPDKALYDAEQEKIKAEIDGLQVKLSAVREKINLATKSGTGNDRRAVLRAELDSIRGQQSNNKNSRGKVIEQLKSLQDGIQKKVKDLQAAKAKTPFKTVAEVDNHIKHLEKQVESGNMKLVDEKRALQEISQTKRSRRNVEAFQADQEAIEADRRAADELRKELDDPESKAVSERYDAIKAELDELKKEGDIAYAGRSKLFEERDGLQAQLNTLYNKKRESAQTFREANDRFYTKLNEDRARRAERARAQRAAEEAEKKLEVAERLREEAAAPAYQAFIEDCQTLIDYFLGKNSGNNAYASAPLSTKTQVAGVPELELRKVEDAPEGGVVIRKKKGEEQDAYFVGGGKKKGKSGKKGGAADAPKPESNGAAASGGQLNVPLPTLSALLTLSIPPPTSSADVPRVVEDLKTKKAWYEANQARVTAENVAKAEAEIKRLTNGKAEAPSSAPQDIAPPNGGGETPAEPAPTPQVDSELATKVSSSEVDAKLEEVKEAEEQ
ncbi:hypothetical protein PLICRDRAFT_34016 [Plicaturopsis crispa FD-325 SS-3]|nr:hypothetical protein PLICRDRAFT_34016 [Plicaturopsis crispa FD-325 SS-3]